MPFLVFPLLSHIPFWVSIYHFWYLGCFSCTISGISLTFAYTIFGIHVPLSVFFMYHFWYFLHTNSGIYTKNGTNKPIGLLQDTHFVHTKYILLGGKPLKPPFNNQRHLHPLLSMLTRGIYPFLHSLII